MASYTVPAGHVGVHEKTMVAGTVDTITFPVGSSTTPGWGQQPENIEVLTDGTASVYVTVDGSTPTVAGTHCYRIPAMAGSTVISVADSNGRDDVVVKMISSGTPQYSVSRA